MMNVKKLKWVLLSLGLFLFAANSWALDADEDEDEDAAKDSTSKTEDAAAESGANFDPPHDEHVNPVAPVDTHASGASAAGGASLAAASTDPSAVLTQFQNFVWTTGTSDDNNIANTYLLQAVLPMSKSNVLRPALPVVNTPGKTGIGDLFLLDVFLFPIKSGALGFGPVASVPIGVDEFSSNKWQAGPVGLYVNKTQKKFIFGGMVYNQWSFAGKSSASSVNLMNFQPIFVYQTAWGYVGWTDQVASIDWKNDNKSSIPLGLRFGKVYPSKTPLNVAVGFYYTLNNKGRDNTFGIKFQATFIKPKWLVH